MQRTVLYLQSKNLNMYLHSFVLFQLFFFLTNDTDLKNESEQTKFTDKMHSLVKIESDFVTNVRPTTCPPTLLCTERCSHMYIIIITIVTPQPSLYLSMMTN